MIGFTSVKTKWIINLKVKKILSKYKKNVRNIFFSTHLKLKVTNVRFKLESILKRKSILPKNI